MQATVEDEFPPIPLRAERVAAMSATLKGERIELTGGRCILRNGKPFITIGRAGDTAPTDADSMAELIAALLLNVTNPPGEEATTK